MLSVFKRGMIGAYQHCAEATFTASLGLVKKPLHDCLKLFARGLDMGRLLSSTEAKIARAKKHLAELEVEVAAFHGRNPYRIETDRNSEPGHELYRFRFVEAIPREWGTVIGDVIHNLRGALDNLATSLAVHNGTTSQTKLKDTYFPIGATKQVFEKRLTNNLASASPAARRIVQRLKPYKGGTDAFWQLNQLDILDKHYSLIPVGASHTRVGMIFDPNRLFAAHFPDKPLPDFKEMLPLYLAPADTQFPLKDGDVVGKYGFGPDPEGKHKPNFQFTFDIAFGEGQIIDGQPVVSSLQQLVDFVERVVAIFRRHILKGEENIP